MTESTVTGEAMIIEKMQLHAPQLHLFSLGWLSTLTRAGDDKSFGSYFKKNTGLGSRQGSCDWERDQELLDDTWGGQWHKFTQLVKNTEIFPRRWKVAHRRMKCASLPQAALERGLSTREKMFQRVAVRHMTGGKCGSQNSKLTAFIYLFNTPRYIKTIRKKIHFTKLPNNNLSA